MSSVTWMDLVYGAERSVKPQDNLTIAEGLAARLTSLDHDAEAAGHTGRIRDELANGGTPIGPYGQVVTGHALSRGLVGHQ